MNLDYVKTFIYTNILQRNAWTHSHAAHSSQPRTLPPRLRDELFSHRPVDSLGMFIYSAAMLVFSHFLFSNSTLVCSARFTSKRRQYPNLRLPSSPVKTKENISLPNRSRESIHLFFCYTNDKHTYIQAMRVLFYYFCKQLPRTPEL